MMDGAYGQQVVIDFDNNRIITADSVENLNYDYHHWVIKFKKPKKCGERDS